LGYHWHTQPLPTVLAGYADKLPAGFQHFQTAATLGMELLLPFLIFCPRRMRMFGAWGLIGLQVMILATGNYTFFNFLTIALTIFLFVDQALARFVPAEIRETLVERSEGRIPALGAAVIVIILSLAHLL